VTIDLGAYHPTAVTPVTVGVLIDGALPRARLTALSSANVTYALSTVAIYQVPAGSHVFDLGAGMGTTGGKIANDSTFRPRMVIRELSAPASGSSGTLVAGAAN
jgi:hypothetical protein